MKRLALLACCSAFACADATDKSETDPSTDQTDPSAGDDGPSDADDDPSDDESGDDDQDDPPPQATIEATVRVLNAMSGVGMEDVGVENTAGDTTATNASGVATLSVPADSTFSLLLEQEGAIDHLLFGPTGDTDFDYVTFMATEVLVDMVLMMLGATPDDDTAVVVVGIDYDDLSPAVGASATIDKPHDEPWVLSSTGASFGDTILENGMGMVAFSNVQPGEVSVSVTPPDGTECTAYPGGGQMPEAPVEANMVTVVTFHCR